MKPGRNSATPSEQEWVKALASIERELIKLGIRRDGNVFDFTPLPNAVTIDLVEFICRTGLFIIHGSNSELPYPKLLAHQASDASKESGNRRAVYATSDARIGLTRALINHKYLREKLGSYMQGYEVDDRKFVIKATANLYQLFLERDPRIIADGYVYLLNKSGFSPAGGSTNEYHSEEDQAVSTVFRVSQRLRETLLVVGQGSADNVFPYSLKEFPPDKHHPSDERKR